jgi:2-polyprenyl-3-methyl-5-hydroxy-6-metoxy-1,4-benzoquinol methylase
VHPPPAQYWNHNTAYHPWVRAIAARHGGDVLDVGCGDGLLAARLAPVSHSVTGIDPDAAAVERARRRLADNPGVTVEHVDFLEFDPGDRRFDLITFVASLHHMPLQPALLQARRLLRPGGAVAVVGLSANRTVRDIAWSAMCLPVVTVASRWHREVPDIGVVMTDPQDGFDDIRRVAEEVLPGAVMRRALYYRYLLRWENR